MKKYKLIKEYPNHKIDDIAYKLIGFDNFYWLDNIKGDIPIEFFEHGWFKPLNTIKNCNVLFLTDEDRWASSRCSEEQLRLVDFIDVRTANEADIVLYTNTNGKTRILKNKFF